MDWGKLMMCCTCPAVIYRIALVRGIRGIVGHHFNAPSMHIAVVLTLYYKHKKWLNSVKYLTKGLKNIGVTCWKRVIYIDLSLWSACRGPAWFRTRNRNRGQLEFRCHVGPKTVFEDGGDRTRKFTQTWPFWLKLWNYLSIFCHGGKEWLIWYVLPTMSSIRVPRWCRYSTEKCLPESHLPFVYVAILSIFKQISQDGCCLTCMQTLGGQHTG